MPWSPDIRLAPEPARHRVVSGTLANPRRLGQETRRLERASPARFNHLRRQATPPLELGIDDAGTPLVRYGRPRRAPRAAPAPAPAVPLGDSGHLVFEKPPTASPPERRTVRRSKPRADKFIAIGIVRNNGDALRHVAPELKNDRGVVLAAVRNSGRALEHASAALRGDADLVKEAVRQDASALRFASQKLQSDPGVFEAAMASQDSQFGWGDSPKRSPKKSPTKSEFPAPLSPAARDLVPSPRAKEPPLARQGSVVVGSG